MIGLLLMLTWVAPTFAAEPAPVEAPAEPELVTLGTVGGRPITDGQFEFAARQRPAAWSDAEARGRVMAQLVDETLLYLEGIKAGYGDYPSVRRIMADAMSNDERGKQSKAEYAARIRKGYRVEIDQAAAASFDQASSAEPGAVVGRVNGAPVHVDVWAKKSSSRLSSRSATPPDRKQMVDEAVDLEVLVQEAKKIGYLEDYRVVRAVVQHYRQHALGLDVPITDAQLKARYDLDPSDFGLPEKRHVLRLLVKPNEQRKPKKLKKLLANLHKQIVRHPDEFEDVAGVWSDDPSSRRRNGDLGWIDAEGRIGVPRETLEAAFTMKAGEVSDVRVVPEGHEILLVRDIKPAVIRPFEQVILDVEGAVRTETHAARYDEYLATLRKSYPIVIDEAALAQQPLPATRRRK